MFRDESLPCARIALRENGGHAMKWSQAAAARMALAYFFFCPGLSYGILTARMPALQEQADLNEAQIGLILLTLGASSLVALVASGFLLARTGSRAALRFGTLTLLIGSCLCGLAATPLTLGLACALSGLGMGVSDVAMNSQAMEYELRTHEACMALMHGCYSLGCVLGAMSAALFAGPGYGVFVNVVVVLGLYACLRPWALSRLVDEHEGTGRMQPSGKREAFVLPPCLVLCGLLSMVAFASEGAVAEWGSLFLHTVRGADQATAAFAYAAFAAATVFIRLFGDQLRVRFGDFFLAFSGSLVAVCGMSLTLFAGHVIACLAGFALMGAGLSPIVPVLYARAGRCPGVSPARASAIVSTMSYGAMLFFPPLLGFMASARGLDTAMLVVLGCCVVLCVGTALCMKHK